MKGALDQFVDIVLKVHKATIMALDLLESESMTKSKECTEAILSITEVTELAYQFIDKIDYLNYHFHMPEFKCGVERMTSAEHLQQLLNTLGKTTNVGCQRIYMNLKDNCCKVATICWNNFVVLRHLQQEDTQTLQEALEGQLQVQH